MALSSPNVFHVDPSELRIPDGFPAPSAGVGEVVILLADEEARAAGWAGRMAVDLAREWAAADLQVVLADGDVAGATLHRLVGAGNGEGIVDLVLYGASPARVARFLDAESFLFASSGTVAPEASVVHAHPRWPRLLSAFRESGTLLLLYLPAEAGGLEGLIAEGDRVFRLSARTPGKEVAPGIVVISGEAPGPGAGERAETLAGAGPATMPDVSGEAEPTEGFGEGDPVGAFGEGDLVEASGEGEGAEAVEESEAVEVFGNGVDAERFQDDRSVAGEGSAFDEPAGPEPSTETSDAPSDSLQPPPGSHREARVVGRRTTPLLLLVLVILVVVVLAGAWLGYFSIPGLPFSLGSAAPAPAFPLPS